MQEQVLKNKAKNHPFVVIDKDVCNGSPVIEGSRTRVIDIAIEYEILGHSPDEIVRSHPHLDLSQIHDALSYYYGNREELDQKMEQDHEFIEQLKHVLPSKLK